MTDGPGAAEIGHRMIELGAAVTALLFATEPETYPVFAAWATANGMYLDVLTREMMAEAAVRIGEHVLTIAPILAAEPGKP